MNKTILLIATLTLGLFPGLTTQAEAQYCRQQSHIFISGYQRCGTPIYMVRYIAGYDRCGRAIWRVRHLTCDERNGYYHLNQHSRYAGYGESRISYSTSSGRGYTYRYYSNSSGRCRSW